VAEHARSLTVRTAEVADLDEVVRVYVESWNRGFGDLMPVIAADPDRLDRWAAALGQPPPHRWWVAVRDTAIVGFAGIGPSRDPIDPRLGELDTIAVDPRAWRTGVGTELVATALRSLRTDGYRSALLWTLAEYPRGSAFYTSLGWRSNGATRRAGKEARYDHDL
jgi:GNAT superfamily N-acetyltransferase